jgi:hypothetical protein
MHQFIFSEGEEGGKRERERGGGERRRRRRKNNQITVKFTGHCKNVIPHYETSFTSTFWYLEFGGSS